MGTLAETRGTCNYSPVSSWDRADLALFLARCSDPLAEELVQEIIRLREEVSSDDSVSDAEINRLERELAEEQKEASRLSEALEDVKLAIDKAIRPRSGPVSETVSAFEEAIAKIQETVELALG